MTVAGNFPVLARGLLLALIVVAAWNPRLPWQASPVDLVILVDASRSMDPAARDQAWKDVAQRARRLPARSRVAVVRFGARAVEELPLTDVRSRAARAVLAADTPPHSRYVDDTGTDIAAAMAHALRIADPDRAIRVALISDGRATSGGTDQALTLARRAGIPVYLLPAHPTALRHDSWIQALTVPEHIHVGHSVPVTVTLASQVSTHGDVSISVDNATYTDRQVMLTPSQPTTLHIDVPAPTAASAEISAHLAVDGDPEPRNNRAARIVNIDGSAPVLYLSRGSALPTLARSLRAGGWDVRMTQPAAFQQAMADLQPASIVLDDIAVSDMPRAAWQALTRTVTVHGTGLLVLGGEHAFGAGGYRHSLLEDILPVTAEARQPLPPAAVLFMLDTSGSMDRRDAGPSRLAVARQAVLETARRLQPDDAVGLLEFAMEPDLVLPIAARPDTDAAIRAASQSPPAGGTRLGPALDEAVTTLAGAVEKQKLLILVTDGYVDKGDFGAIARRIKQAGIDVIALAIGPDADTTALLPLTRINNGQLLRVDRIARLPTLMRHEVDKRRSVTETGHFIPAVSTPPPFLASAVTHWPAFSRYAVTRERPSATVYLRAQGDPLLAARYAGAGRVAVLTTGLDAWRGLWDGWPQSGAFAGGLLDWIDAQRGAGDMRVTTHAAGTVLSVETPDSAAAGTPRTRITVRDPSGETRELPLSAQAPGLYEARINHPIPGRYSAVIRVGDNQVRHDWLYGAVREFMPPASGVQSVTQWLHDGLLRPWQAPALAGKPVTHGPGTLRAALLIAATGLYLLVLLWERRSDLVRSAFNRRPRAHRSVAARRPPDDSTSDAEKLTLVSHE